MDLPAPSAAARLFAGVTDPRVERTRRHLLCDILLGDYPLRTGWSCFPLSRRTKTCSEGIITRYKAVAVDTEATEYLLAASVYIPLNPVRADLLNPTESDLRSYRWSSFPRFVGKTALPPWLRRERVFGCLGLVGESAEDRRPYQAWMANRVARRPLVVMQSGA